MTKQQVQLAKQHDWFLAETAVGIWVYDRYTIDGELVTKTKFFDSFAKLRHWAGY